MANDPYLHPRDVLCQYMARIYGYRMTTTSGGNLSIRDPASGEIWITPAKIDKGRLGRSDIVLVKPDGSWESDAPPSSELPLHQIIYRARPDVRAIVHAHPVALVAFSIVDQVPSTRVFHQAWRICGSGAFAPYRLPGSAELGEAIAAALGAAHSCVILENHGVVAVGGDLAEAFQRFETFEFAGKSIIKAHLLGGTVRELSDEDLEVAAEHLPEPDAFTPQAPSTAEQEVRTTLQDFVRRGYRQRLFISTHGTFSARVDTESFVITPHDSDRGALERSDLVLVDTGRTAARSSPSHAHACTRRFTAATPRSARSSTPRPSTRRRSASPTPCRTPARSRSAVSSFAAPRSPISACSSRIPTASPSWCRRSARSQSSRTTVCW